MKNGVVEKSPTMMEGVEIKDQPKKGPSLRESLIEFTQNTTLHGIRYICLEGAFLLRRLLWLIMVIGCASVMAYQIIDRIIYYYQMPVTVNVHVNFNTSLQFPSVTICNQNAFRATAATEAGWYRLLEEMYAQSGEFNMSALDTYHARNISLDTLFLQTAHKKEDMVVACEWQTEECDVTNFTTVLTDHGVCYSFNIDDIPLPVSSTGSDYGLKLTLNVEQYEYMPGPHDAAGVKLLLHDRKEFPKVHELGLAIPTGSHAFIGIQLVSIANLPKPHGDCGISESPYYERYSTDSCQLTCMSELLEEKCGCRHHFMPNVNNKPPICTLEQYYSCYQKIIAEAKVRVRNECSCPIPCSFLIFDPTISFATTSLYATDRLLSSAGLDVEQKFLKARETTNRMDKAKFGHFRSMEQEVTESLNKLKSVMFDEVEKNILAEEVTMSSIWNKTISAWDKKMHLYQWQKYIVQKNFMRAREAMEERTLNYLALGFQEFSYQIEAKIVQLANDSIDPVVRESIYLITLNELGGRMDLADRAYDNYTQLYEAYNMSAPIFRYKYLTELRDDNIYIGPHVLLKHALVHSAYAKKYSNRVGDDILDFKEAMARYADLANTAFYNGTINKTEMYLTNVNFLWRGRRFYHSKSTFYFESIEYPLRILEKRIEDFEMFKREFSTHWKTMVDNLDSLQFSLESLKGSIIDNLNHGIKLANIYFEHGNVSKLEVARQLTEQNIYDGISNMKIFFQEVRSRGQNVYDGWLDLIKSTTAIWEAILVDEDMTLYYEYKNMTDFLRNYTVVAGEIDHNYTECRNSMDFRFLIGTADSTFLKSLDNLMNLMTSFLDTSKVDSAFIQENFLQLDIFYRERSYEQITQQVAYDEFALLCDIGGSMGLFVGASVLTIFEVVDLVFHQTVYRLTDTKL